MIGQELLRFYQGKYIVFDFETEGLNLFRSKPWQLAWLECQGRDIIKENDYYLFWPDLNINPQAKIVTHFNELSYKNRAIDPIEVLKKFDAVLYNEDYLLVGHNILAYDIYIHSVLRRLCGFKVDYSYLGRCIDTNCISKAYKKGFKKPPSEDLLSWQLKIEDFVEKGLKTSLSTMGREFGIEVDYDALHDGLNDIKLNRLVYQKLLVTVDF